MLTPFQSVQKRLFDVVLSLIGIGLTWWLMLLAWLVASLETRSNGFFVQTRIGREGKPFRLFKVKTMKPIEGFETTVTTGMDPRITKSGELFRKTKIDELPQLWNVLFGSMSFVGPRPDVEGFADTLEGEDSIILEVAPGITGPASLKYRDEEDLLSKQKDPERYNKEVLWPDKVQINKAYIKAWSLKSDIDYIIQTILG